MSDVDDRAFERDLENARKAGKIAASSKPAWRSSYRSNPAKARANLVAVAAATPAEQAVIDHMRSARKLEPTR